MRVAQSVSIPESERAALSALSDATNSVRARIALRAQAILLAGEGKTNDEIARMLGAIRQTVSRWRKLYAQVGMPAITTEQPRSGRKPIVTEHLIAEIIQLRQQKKKWDGGRWTHQNLAMHFNISVSTVRSVLRNHGRKSVSLQ